MKPEFTVHHPVKDYHGHNPGAQFLCGRSIERKDVWTVRGSVEDTVNLCNRTNKRLSHQACEACVNHPHYELALLNKTEL